MDTLVPIVLWYLATSAVALAFAPLAMLAFRHVADRGASLIRPLGLLALIWPVWFLASIDDGLVSFSPATLWIGLGLVALVSWVVGIRAGAVTSAGVKHLIVAEAGYLVLFAVFV